MKSQKRLTLRRETMSELRSDELGGIVAGNGWEIPPSVALCQFTAGQSCGGVCSGYCETYTCPAFKLVETIQY